MKSLATATEMFVSAVIAYGFFGHMTEGKRCKCFYSYALRKKVAKLSKGNQILLSPVFERNALKRFTIRLFLR